MVFRMMGLLVGIALSLPIAMAQEDPATLQAGDLLQVIEGGKLRDAQFVELTASRQIKVKLEDGRQKTFAPNFVRRHPKAKPSVVVPAVPAEPKAIGGKRTWTDATGQFKIEAAFMALADGKVQLKKLDGKIISLPMEKLSAEDQSFAQALAKAVLPETPIEPVPMPAANPTPPMTEVAKVDVPRPMPNPSPPTATPLDLPAKVEIPAGAEVVMRFRPENAPKLQLKGATFVALPPDRAPGAGGKWLSKLSVPSNRYEAATGLEVDTERNLCWFSVGSRLERVDLITGRVLPTLSFSGEHRLAAIDPLGTIIVTRPQERPAVDHQHSGVAFWRLEPSGTLKLVLQLIPFDESVGNNKQSDGISSVLVAQGGIAILHSRKGVLLWNIGASQAVGHWDDQVPCAVGLSAGGKVAAVAGSEGLCLLDPSSGHVVSRLAIPGGTDKSGYTRVGFSNDGAQVAVASASAFWIFNLTDGSCVKHVSGLVLPDRYHECSLNFTPHNTLTFDERFVYDYEREIMLGEISQSGPTTTAGGRRLAISVGSANGKTSHSITALVVPDDALERTAQAEVEKLVLHTRPGSTISVAVHVGNYKVDPEPISKALEEKCIKNGWKVVPADAAAEYQLVASYEPHAQQEITYFVTGGDRTIQRFTVTTIRARLTICPAGSAEPVFLRGDINVAPSGFTLKQGEKIEDRVQPKPQPEFFIHMAIPAKIFQYPNRAALLKIDCTERGVSVRPAQ